MIIGMQIHKNRSKVLVFLFYIRSRSLGQITNHLRKTFSAVSIWGTIPIFGSKSSFSSEVMKQGIVSKGVSNLLPRFHKHIRKLRNGLIIAFQQQVYLKKFQTIQRRLRNHLMRQERKSDIDLVNIAIFQRKPQTITSILKFRHIGRVDFNLVVVNRVKICILTKSYRTRTKNSKKNSPNHIS